VVTAQQTLVTTITTYVTTLGAMWQAVVDVANLLQTRDLFQMGLETPATECVGAVPDLEQLLALPCCHPCSPTPEPWLKGGAPQWPPAVPDADEKPMPPANGAGEQLPPPRPFGKREEPPGSAK
jgi:hypothetical protein